MKICLKFTVAVLFILPLGFVFNANSQTIADVSASKQNSDEQTAVNNLREFYQMRDYESGYEVGRKLVEKFPANVELQAWFIVNMARNEMTKEAVTQAQKLVEKNQENAWAQFALAHALIRDFQPKKAAPVAEKALTLAPDDEEFAFLYESSLLNQQKYDEIYPFLDKNAAKIKDQARFWAAKGETQYRQATAGKLDEAKKKLAFESLARAAASNPESILANYIYGLYLYFDKQFAESLPFLKKAVALSPKSAYVRQQYWNAILNGQPDKAESQRKAEVVADMNDLLKNRPDSPVALNFVAQKYGEMQMSDHQIISEMMLRKQFPASRQAEALLAGEYREFAAQNSEFGKFKNEKLRQKFVEMLRAFINRPQHNDEILLGNAYFRLFLETKNDAALSNRELLDLVENTAKYEKQNPTIVFPQGAELLANRQMFREAEKIARQGLALSKTQADETNSSDAEEFNYQNSRMLDALGWVFYKENKFDEAEKYLLEAEKTSETDVVFNHLGTLYETKKDFDKAENFYIKAYSNFYGKDNPNVAALKNLYEKRNPKADGFEAYFEKVKILEREMRHQRIVADKIVKPQSVEPFNLKNLKGAAMLSGDLAGKIVIVNIWGTWCGPCVAELPELQALHKKYQGDKDVAILTINNDEDLKVVSDFMARKKYDFTVLRDENYLQVVGINVFPTTWFISRDGKISYIKVGSSDKLLEEFGWRIEELKK